MRNTTLCTVLVLAGTLSAAILPAGTARAERSIQEQCSLDGHGEVEVSTLSGTVDLVAGTAGEVLVTGTIGDDVEELVVDCRDDRVSVELKLPHGSGERNLDADAHLQITLPAGATVAVSTVSADITASDLRGELELESVSGGIDVDGDPRALEASSVSGNVSLKGVSAAVKVESVSGNVLVEQARGRLEASSVSGSVQILGGTVEAGSLESLSGDVSCAAAVAPGGRLSVESHSGSMKIQLPSGSGASIRVSTFSGAIVNDLGPEQATSGDYGPGSTLNVEVSGGGGRIDVETFSGDVHLGSG